MATNRKRSNKEAFMIIGYGLKILLVVYLPIIAFFIFIIAWLGSEFLTPKKDTTIFLSVGFAMLIGLASVCFSWVKTIDGNEENDQKTKKVIKVCGESFFITALYMVVAIALQYVSLKLDDPKLHSLIFLGKICYWLSYIIIMTVVTYFTVSFSKLLHLLFIRVDNNIRDL
jgi:hypothetical protein